jgi:hypothetical protein
MVYVEGVGRARDWPLCTTSGQLLVSAQILQSTGEKDTVIEKYNIWHMCAGENEKTMLQGFHNTDSGQDNVNMNIIRKKGRRQHPGRCRPRKKGIQNSTKNGDRHRLIYVSMPRTDLFKAS